jgi:5-methylthioribose kinase
LKLWATKHSGDVFSPKFFEGNEDSLEVVKKEYMLNLLHDTLGFAGAKMIR